MRDMLTEGILLGIGIGLVIASLFMDFLYRDFDKASLFALLAVLSICVARLVKYAKT